MAQTTVGYQGGVTVDGVPLKVRLRKAERLSRLKAYGLILPVFLFIVVFFMVPIGLMMYRSVHNPLLQQYLPKTLEVLDQWDVTGAPTPPLEVYEIFAEELSRAYKQRSIGKIATRLNYDRSGMRSLIMKTGRKISRIQVGPFKEADWKNTLIKIDKRWGQRETWTTIKQVGEVYTPAFYLAALDMTRTPEGDIVSVPESRAIYVDVFIRTIWISVIVTVMCLLLGYPVAYLLSSLPVKYSNMLMILVLLPFWTSLLVRTTAWVVVLQTEGVLNDLLITLGLITERVQLIFNRFGVIVAMTHILLPFMILPVFSVMKTISPAYVRAAKSMGASDWTAFWRVYFPQTVPGIGAGVILVFILSLGYYITPALVGGPTDQMVSYFIADHTNRSLNWGLASALGGILLAGVMALYIIYNRIVGIDNMKLG